MSSLFIFDGLGWIGSACVVVPYALVSSGRLAGTTPTFRWLNTIGGVLLLLNTWYHSAYPSVVVNAIWILIGVYSVVRARP